LIHGEQSEPGREEAAAPKAPAAGIRPSSPSEERGGRARRGAERALIDDYARLLGYPAGKPLEGDVLARAEEALDWYRRHGKPRVVTRVVGSETLAAITAGFEVEDQVAKLWASERVDEAYFLDRLAAAVVEHLAASLGNGRSPGHRGFPIEEQSKLYALVEPEEIELLPSGMLRPVHSILAVYDPSDESAQQSPCSLCDWRCSFRRKAA